MEIPRNQAPSDLHLRKAVEKIWAITASERTGHVEHGAEALVWKPRE